MSAPSPACAPAIALGAPTDGAAPLDDSTVAILARAAGRARAARVAYAGLVTPDEAHRLAGHGARIVDVRTRPEWELVGHVPGSVLVEWQTYPGGVRNERFLEALAEAIDDRDETLLFLCRSGQRSHHAAAAAGYPRAFNILEGFEGDRDANGQRGTLGGWRRRGLPWLQS